MRKLILFIFILISITIIASAKKLWLADKNINPYNDNVDIYIDTIGIDINKYFQYNQKREYKIYSKLGYLIMLDNDLITKDKENIDSADYENINNSKTIKNKFKDLKEKFGNYKILKNDTRFSKSGSNGVNDNPQNSFKVFPNPANSTVLIERGGIEAADLRILDITGRICLYRSIQFGETQIQVDISKLTAGRYIIEINNETGSLVVE